MSEPVLSVKNLSVNVGAQPLIHSISFDVNPGEIFALVGESGSGKSLTSLAIMRLLPPGLHPTQGEIQLQNQNLFQLTERQMQKVRGRQVAMIFQEPMTSLNPVMKVGDQVAEVLRWHLHLNRRDAREKTIELFKEVGIPDPDNRYDWFPHQLSGGQKQRVMIAMALACEPDVLIADEPTTALDVTIQAQVLNLLKRIRGERGLSILFITHDMGVVNEIADRVAVMQQGKIVEMAETHHFFTQPEHPYTKTLLENAMPKRQFQVENVAKPVLSVKDVKVHFPVKKGLFQRTVGYIKAVDGVDLTLYKGQTLALVGESGSGKSTIGQAILKLVKVTDGEVRYCSTNEQNEIAINQLSEQAMKPFRRRMQVIFQDPFSALNPRMTVSEIIREGMNSLHVGPKEPSKQDARIDELLEQVGLLPEHKYRYPHEFSGGQRQRIGIARALAVEPEIIICDEPTSALDVSVRAQVLSLLESLQREYDLSYLFITHDLSIVPGIAHRVAVMQAGKIVEEGPVEEVMLYPKHDYTRQLLHSAPKLVRESVANTTSSLTNAV